MADRPVLFSGPMVRAILEGRKTQTRRVLKPQIETFDVAPGRPCAVDIAWDVDDGKGRIWKGSYQDGAADLGWKKGTGVLTTQTVPYAPGDRLWVRETWKRDGADSIAAATADFEDAMGPQLGPTFYAADAHPMGPSRYWPSIHMPRWASRLTLTVTDVRVQRLQDISEDDAKAEGIEINQDGYLRVIGWRNYGSHQTVIDDARLSFGTLWDSINGKREGANWDANPWVVTVSFTAEKRNIDDKSDPAYNARLISAASLDPL